MDYPKSREVALEKGKSALLVIDLQKFCAVPGYGGFKDIDPDNIPEDKQYFFDRIQNTVIPSLQQMLTSCRSKKVDVIYTYIECLTRDGRDQSLDYKISGFLVPKGSPGAAILEAIKPEDDDILIPKTSCSVFNSTNIEYVLRNLGVTQLVVTGIVTNQCVEGAVRDAADRGFLVTVIEDAIATFNQKDHDSSLKNMAGFARIIPHDQLVREVQDL